jgi:hypothetical protein
MPITVINGPIIAAGESLSAGVDLTAGTLVRITTPAVWDGPANLTFQVSSDGAFFNDAYDVLGREITIPCGPARGIIIRDIEAVLSASHLKIRSGSAAHPVPQAAQREFAVAILT